MKAVICNFNLFDLHQRIYVVDDHGTKAAVITTLDRLGEDILNTCVAEDTNYVKLIGSAEYAKQIVTDIDKENKMRYNNSKEITIEVNEHE